MDFVKKYDFFLVICKEYFWNFIVNKSSRGGYLEILFCFLYFFSGRFMLCGYSVGIIWFCWFYIL